MIPLDNTNSLLKDDQDNKTQQQQQYNNNNNNNTLSHSWQTISMKLKKEETSCLLYEVCKLYHVQIQEVLLTGLFIAWMRWKGESMLVINFEGHGREIMSLESNSDDNNHKEKDDDDEDDDYDNISTSIIDITNTVGCFTNIFPVYLMRGDIRKGVSARRYYHHYQRQQQQQQQQQQQRRRQQHGNNSNSNNSNSNSGDAMDMDNSSSVVVVVEVSQTLKSIKEQVRSSLSSKGIPYQRMKYLMIPPMNESEMEEYELFNELYSISQEMTFKYVGQIWEKEKGGDETVVGGWDEKIEEMLLLSNSSRKIEEEKEKEKNEEEEEWWIVMKKEHISFGGGNGSGR